ncbi:oligopeptidase A [Marinomonas mediterranea]|jgi:oligopeptidase A (EC:3.4.24.70). Metallo peptidase. MEROPS family M03A|uniref:oligopeptidase A n=1 Tax=Marinomonas mediterranea (strain ATCC 700492 / JCM 21426 / NBRC 103028 / MMB-1) TaxID=717774 RepID=F2JW94_MARM1|nr:oligopeptidase A [Marinomonas mediterranea]ADZ89482.1 Oligopeptidase A [Marinomonas mediterranea MMB-1]WCN15732.1 oligopeptidase A [Marinomonas mediterranea MMB-1]
MSESVWSATTLPQFTKVDPSKIESQLDAILEKNRSALAECLENIDKPSWDNLIMVLDELDDELSQFWSPVSHLNSVQNTPEIREAYNACIPKLTQYYTEIGQNRALYDAYKALEASDSAATHSQAQKESLKQAIRGLELSGVGLDGEKKERYSEISQRLSELTTKFGENVLDATQAWSKLITDETELAGLPDSALAQAKQMAEAKGHDEGWLFTLDFPSYMPVLSYSDNAALREEMYTAYATRASELSNDGQYDNRPLIDEILSLRHEQAQVLGFENYAELSVATKMADSGDQVIDFLTDLASKSKPSAELDLKQLKEFAKEEHGLDDLNAWDLGYYSEKLRQHKYAISQEALRPYFPINKVLGGLFHVAETLFDIDIREESGFDTYHKDVQMFTIAKNGQDVARFYLDPFAREGKRGGAWMDECRVRRRLSDNQLQLPVAYLVCNFTPPIGDKPALLTHNEVTTLFHEFGHGIHHMLTQVEVPSVSGINGVAWDAVELPSQFMENWCWEPEALAYIASHHESGEPLPKDLLDKMLAAKNFQSAMQIVRQLEFSLFDFRIHKEYKAGLNVQTVISDVRATVSVTTPPAFNRFQNSFSHIFAGGYAAGYYSYKWAEVLSADAFSKFEEDGIFNTETGAHFRDTILANGGSQPAADLFKAFRGREPSVDALLRHSGIAA